MALAIPINTRHDFGVVYMQGIDLRQVYVATVMIALGLLVDVPVVSRYWNRVRPRGRPAAQYCGVI